MLARQHRIALITLGLLMVLAVIARNDEPANAAVECTWGEVKACYANPPVNGNCCPKPKEDD